MRLFKINEITYGWFEAELGKCNIEVSDYLGYDMPCKLLVKLINIIQMKSKEEVVYLMNEPGAELLKISGNDTEIIFELLDIDKHSDDLKYDADEREELVNCTKCLGSYSESFASVVDNFVSEFALYENGNGRKMYETHWGIFPQKEFDELKSIAFSINSKQEKKNKLFCTTFLKKNSLWHK